MAGAPLSTIAAFIKSANAGASLITFDIGFADAATFDRVVRSGSIDASVIGALYGVPAAEVRIYPYLPSSTIKITIPRAVISGGPEERDFDGVQQFAPLLDLPVTLAP